MPLRHQDPTTGRWNGIDPVTHFSSSTYASHNNNPIYWSDPSGADWTVFKDFVQGLVGRSRDGLVTQGYRGSFGSFAKSVGGRVLKKWAGDKLSGALGNELLGGGGVGVSVNANSGDPDFYLNLKTGEVEQIEGSEDLFDQDYIHLGSDDASIDDILKAISERNFIFVTNSMYPNGIWVDTKSAYTAWIMMQIYSPEIVGNILFLSIAGVESNTVAPKGFRGSYTSSTGMGDDLFNFTPKTAKHFANPARTVPIQIVNDVLKNTKGLPDPRGSRALMHYSKMMRGGKVYNLQILYDKLSNTIWHFHYGREAMGPLKAIPK